LSDNGEDVDNAKGDGSPAGSSESHVEGNRASRGEERKSRKERLADTFSGWSPIFEGLVALTAIGGFVLICVQSYFMLESNRLTQESNRITNQSLIQAQRDSDAARKATEISQRARLGVEVLELNSQQGTGLWYRVIIRNYGLTPAFDVTSAGGSLIVAREDFKFPVPMVSSGRVEKVSSVINAGAENAGAMFMDDVGAGQIEAIQNGSQALHAVGEVRYRDVFGAQHVTRFCYYFLTRGGVGGWVLCPQYNTSD